MKVGGQGKTIAGFMMRTFAHLKVVPISTAIGTGEAFPALIELSPMTPLVGAQLSSSFGRIKVTAPNGWAFDINNRLNFDCRFEIVKLGSCFDCRIPYFSSQEKASTLCYVGISARNEATITFLGRDGFEGGGVFSKYKYSITLFVLNPKILLLKKLPWLIQSFVKDPLQSQIQGYDAWVLMDEGSYEGYTIKQPAPILYVEEPSDKRGDVLQADPLRISFRFPSPVLMNDHLSLTLPNRYKVEDEKAWPTRGKCLYFEYDPDTMKLPPETLANDTLIESVLLAEKHKTVDPDNREVFEGTGYRILSNNSATCMSFDQGGFLQISNTSSIDIIRLWNPYPPGVYIIDSSRDIGVKPIPVLKDDSRKSITEMIAGESSAQYMLRKQAWKTSPYLFQLYSENYVDDIMTMLNNTEEAALFDRPFFPVYSTWENVTHFKCEKDRVIDPDKPYYPERDAKEAEDPTPTARIPGKVPRISTSYENSNFC